jgi:chromosome segregation ATPase
MSSTTASTTVKQHISAVSSNLHASRSDHEDAAFAKSMKKMLAEESNRWDNRIATLFSDHGTSGQSGTEKHVALQARIDTHVRLLHMAQKREVQYTKLYMKASSRKKASGNGESGTGVTTTENDSTFVDELQAKMKDAAYRVQRYQVELDTLQAQQQSHVQQEQQMTNHAAGAMPSSSPSTATGGPSIQQWSIPLMNRKRGANHLSSI